MIGELAVALVAIGTKTVVGQLTQGTPVTRDTWADASKQIIDALVSHSSRQDAGFGRISGQIARVSRQIDDISVREFNEHMAAGRRHLRDLPVDWRTERDRRELTHDARVEFVRAFAIAEQMKDAQRQALADVAIGGCWLWAGSLRDAQGTFGKAREVLERDLVSPQFVSVQFQRHGDRPQPHGRLREHVETVQEIRRTTGYDSHSLCRQL